MPNSCYWCNHPKRPVLEAAVGGGQATKHAVKALGEFDHYQSAVRHMRTHVGVRNAPQSGSGGVSGVSSSPVETFRAAFGVEPMPWQVEYLTETRDTAVRKGRQVGATQAAAGLAIHTARSRAGADVVVISPSQRQSTEIVVRARLGFDNLDEKLAQDSAGLLRLKNGSRILSLPGNSRGIRGYAPALVVLDEAAWIAPETFMAARPLVAASKGRLVIQSTPDAASEWFKNLALDPPPGWAQIVVRSSDVPTIDPEFLAREEREMAEWEYRQEYLAEFPEEDKTIGQIWTADQWERLVKRPKEQA